MPSKGSRICAAAQYVSFAVRRSAGSMEMSAVPRIPHVVAIGPVLVAKRAWGILNSLTIPSLVWIALWTQRLLLEIRIDGFFLTADGSG